MNPNDKRAVEIQAQNYSSLLDVLIRAGLILGLAILCFQIFSPFLTLMMWALMLAVTLYPAQQIRCGKAGGEAGPRRDLSGLAGDRDHRGPDRGPHEFAGRLDSRLDQQRAERHARDSGPARFRRGLARGRPEGACAMVAGARRSSRAHQEHAAEDRRHCQVGSRLRRQHRGRPAAVPGLLHHRRHSHGLRGGGRPWRSCHLRSTGRHGAWRGVRETVHGDHPCRGPGRHRRCLHPGDHHRRVPARRRHTVGRRPCPDRAGARHRPGAGAHCDLARHWLHLVERGLRHRRGRRPIRCCSLPPE